MAFSLDLNSLTIGEAEELCTALGITDVRELSKLHDGAIPPAMLPVVAWLFKKKEDPTFTMAQARALTLTEVSLLFGVASPNAPATASSVTS